MAGACGVAPTILDGGCGTGGTGRIEYGFMAACPGSGRGGAGGVLATGIFGAGLAGMDVWITVGGWTGVLDAGELIGSRP
jgi:hypothetical protein